MPALIVPAAIRPEATIAARVTAPTIFSWRLTDATATGPGAVTRKSAVSGVTRSATRSSSSPTVLALSTLLLRYSNAVASSWPSANAVLTMLPYASRSASVARSLRGRPRREKANRGTGRSVSAWQPRHPVFAVRSASGLKVPANTGHPATA